MDVKETLMKHVPAHGTLLVAFVQGTLCLNIVNSGGAAVHVWHVWVPNSGP